ncbi:diphthine--ammonia ligase [Candidatus Pacearchaeota archaeon]|nr:diphthine--ammonia ligase [Candidatus Pacearchaeota archaeon]
MKLGLLFSGGKDSAYAGYLAKKYGHEISCLISIKSANPYSYMFHTPSIHLTETQAQVMNIPIIIKTTLGKKESELKDLKKAIKEAKEKHKIQGIITGAVGSVYQATRIQKICNELSLECFNPLWQKNQFELLENLIKNKFEVIVTGVFAYPLNEKWVGRKIDNSFISDMKKLNEKYKINPAGEGGEFETLVINCPLFKKPLKMIGKRVWSDDNEKSWRAEVILK